MNYGDVQPEQHTEGTHTIEPDTPWWEIHHLMHHLPGEAWAGIFGAIGLIAVALIGLWRAKRKAT